MSQPILNRVVTAAVAVHRVGRHGEGALVFLAIATPYVAVAAVAAWFWRRGVGPAELSILAVGYMLTMVGLAAGYHRLFAHRSFQAAVPLRMLLAVFGSMAGQGPVSRWVAMHRRRHQLGDRLFMDPSLRDSERSASRRDTTTWDVRWAPDLARDRAIAGVNRHYRTCVILGLALPAVAGGLHWGTWGGVFSGFFWGGVVRMILVHHAVGIAEVFGGAGDEGPFRNVRSGCGRLALALLTWGESWRDNHRAYPTSAAHGLEWRQIDVTYGIIRAWEFCGLAWDVQRPVSQRVRDKAAIRRPLAAG